MSKAGVSFEAVEARKEQHLTQSDLTKGAGTQKSNISRLKSCQVFGERIKDSIALKREGILMKSCWSLSKGNKKNL